MNHAWILATYFMISLFMNTVKTPYLINQYDFRPSEDSPGYNIMLYSDVEPTWEHDFQLLVQIFDEHRPSVPVQQIMAISETAYPKIHFDDMNFDGFPDLGVRVFEYRSLHCRIYVYLWDNQRQRFSEEPVVIENEYELYPEQKLIELQEVHITGCWSGFFRIEGNELAFRGSVSLEHYAPDITGIRACDSESNILYNEKREDPNDRERYKEWWNIIFEQAARPTGE